MSSKAALIIFDGVEPIESMTTLDVLSRAGYDVTLISIHNQDTVNGAFGMTLKPHTVLSRVQNQLYDIVVMPGGPGSNEERNHQNKDLHLFLKKHRDQDKFFCAICAGVLTLAHAGVVRDKQITSWPAVREKVKSHCRTYLNQRVVVDGKTITSQGPGTAMQFALSIVKATMGKEAAVKVGQGILAAEVELEHLHDQ
ncbi:hypothetical protein GEMRC1_000199 [Eukaryota sp. GEM-RC1]